MALRPHSLKKSVKVLRILSLAYVGHKLLDRPLWGHLYVTRKCNLSCEYCFFKDSSKKDLPRDELMGILDTMWTMGIRFLAFHGGEPTLRADFVDLVAHAVSRGFFTYLNTNGTRLSAEYIDKLGKAGIDIINLSVDSILEFRPSQKDYSRSKQVLSDLLAARDRHKFEITVNYVLNSQNVADVFDTLDLMTQFGIPMSIGIIVKNPHCDSQQQALLFRTDEEKEQLFAALERLEVIRRRGANIIEPAEYFKDVSRFARGELEWECLAGKDSIGIDTQGELKFCGTLPSEALTIHDIAKYSAHQLHSFRKAKYGDCHTQCVTNCRYVTAYYNRHPLRFIQELARI